MLCFFTCTAIISIFVTCMWAAERRRLDLLFWAGAFWLGAFGILLLAFRGVGPAWLTIGIGNALALSSPGLFWLGFRAFDGERPHYWLTWAPPLIWAVLYFGVPAFAADINARVILVSVLIFVLSVLIAQTARKGGLKEASPARTAVVYFFASHALVYLARVPLAIYAPLTESDGNSVSGWFGYFAFELYVHALFAGMAIFVLVRERIERHYRSASEADPLTGVFNRRAFLARLGQGLVQRNSIGALALLDIDHFKRINDCHGHPTGDAALCAFCGWIGAALTPGMVFGRIGGEEFALWMPNMSGDEALAFCDAIRAKVGSHSIATDRRPLAFTVSVGLCTDLAKDRSIEFAMGVADHALYLSKRNGRDRVTAIRAQDGLTRAAESLGEVEDLDAGLVPLATPTVRLV